MREWLARMFDWARRDRLQAELDDLLAQLDDYPVGRPLANARHGLEALRIAGRYRAQELARRRSGQDRDRDLRADALHGDQLEEEVALFLGR